MTKRSTPRRDADPPAIPTTVAPEPPPARRLGRWFAVGLALAIAAGAGLWVLRAPSGAEPAVAAPTGVAAKPPGHAAYVDNKSCLGCHQAQGRQWQQSHHAQAMAAPTPESVRGDFNDTEFRHQGIRSRFFRRGEKFFVNTDGPDGRLADFEIAYTFGVAPLQQYLIALPGGRLQPLQIAWDVPRKRWFHLLPSEKAPAGDVLHWTGRYQTANTMCIACHTTGFEKRYDAASDSFASRWAEPNVSCQSCHGPGERHVQWAAAKAEGNKPAAPVTGQRYGLSVDFKTMGASQQAEVCAACHSRRSELSATPVPGHPKLDNYLPSLLREGLYHADGQQLDEVFVDGSFRQSKMYQKGVTCSHCHNPHSGQLRVAGNAVCTQCHQPAANAAFPSATGNFDSPAHHFHPAGSAGAQCASCHMPSKNYMQIQARPDHSLRVPRPDLTLKIGTPNACTGCHADKPAQWAADKVAQWYGPKRRQEPHYGEAFAAARAGKPLAHDALARLVADPQSSPVVRATALSSLRFDAGIGASERIQATRDADPEVRAAAAESLEGLSAAQRLYALPTLLRDPVRAVRIAAARSLLTLPPAQIDATTRPAFEAALAEYIAAQSVALDMPGPQLNLAVVYQHTGRVEQAEQHYLAALKIDPDFTPARANLAQLYSATSRNADAERVLTEGLKRLPELGELQYSLGLLLAEEKRLPEAAKALAKAARLLPARARIQYNLGLVWQQLGQARPAEAALLEAQRLDPLDAAAPYALAVFYAQAGQRSQALEWAEKLLALNPTDPQANQLVARLRGKG
jgi:predicted CXXCH cytochrome family protein